MRRWAELVGACTLLTRLPVGGLAAAHPPPGDCVWAYPLAGALAGGLGAGVLSLAMAAGLPQPLAAGWALAITVLLTGGLHEDGLADTADGFGGGRTPERKLAIMRDSRIGSFGALALLFSAGLRGTALSLSPRPALALLLAGVLGRGAMLLPLLLLRPARPDGLAASLGQRQAGRLATGLAVAATGGLAVAATTGLGASAATAAAGLAGLLVAGLARRQVGGYTGDVLGAAEQAAECAALTVLAV